MDNLKQRLRRVSAGLLEDPLPAHQIEDPQAFAARRNLSLPAGFAYPNDLIPSAILLPIVEHNGQLHVLLTRRAHSLPDHGGEIGFPGGRCAPEESPLETALRETEEEIGLQREFVTSLGYLPSMPTSTLYLMHPVVGFINPGFTLTLCEREVAEVIHFPLDTALIETNYEPINEDLGYGSLEGMVGIRHQTHWIWGATITLLQKIGTLAFAP